MPRAATATSRDVVKQRAYRKRIAVGVAIAPAPYNARILDYLIHLGWLEGRDVTIEYHWAEGRSERFAEIAVWISASCRAGVLAPARN